MKKLVLNKFGEKYNKLTLAQQSKINLQSYKNEFDILSPMFDKMSRAFCRTASLEFCKQLEQVMEFRKFNMKDGSEKITESNNLRKEGNKLFTAKGNQRNVLGACRLYNDAIFAALDCEGSVEVALGFANRAIALQKFGYYQQAYDDCLCALKYKYPEAMRHKIIARLAYCALKLEDKDALERHLKELQQYPLNDDLQEQCNEMQQGLETLKNSFKTTNDDLEEVPLNRDSTEIIDTGTIKGRSMQAKCFIAKNQLVFSERASSFIPQEDNGHSLCHQCGITSFIPYPCVKCSGHVVYCSLKCQALHQTVHEYECPGYRLKLFASVGDVHLALRMILDGIPTILDQLKTKKTSTELWNSLTEGGDIWQSDELEYAQSLRMASNLDKMYLSDIRMFAVKSHLLVVYLKEYTKFFDIFKECNTKCDWELVIASLILRHIGQVIANTHSLMTLISRPSFPTSTKFHLLNDKIWNSPGHLNRGYLHSFRLYDEIAILNLPYHAMCNHSCVQTIQPTFSGRYISTFALRDLEKGDQITTCYNLDCRKMKSADRQRKLRETYHFDCQCENCVKREPDVDFNEFHQYRCDNKDCGEIFVPNIPDQPSLVWWNSTNPILVCTKCGREQCLDWNFEILYLCEQSGQTHIRRRIYQLFKSLDRVLLGLSEYRSSLAYVICFRWFQMVSNNGIAFNNQDYKECIEMCKYVLKCTKRRSGVNSPEYVADMTYLWDILALGKYKCSKAEMEEMLHALNVIPEDYKMMFLNYYKDYIKVN